MAKQTNKKAPAIPVRKDVTARSTQGIAIPTSPVRVTPTSVCEDCRAYAAFQAWHDVELTPSYNWEVSFDDWNLVPKGKRAVIELVTATVIVPSGEWARLRMYTSLGTVPSNLDLFLTFQGSMSGNSNYVATHSVRVYTDRDINFNINRDNATTSGHAFICISGYIAG